MTIRDLAQASGISRSTLGKMLNGDAGMDADNLYAVSQVLGVALHDLIARAEGSLPPEDPPVALVVE